MKKSLFDRLEQRNRVVEIEARRVQLHESNPSPVETQSIALEQQHDQHEDCPSAHVPPSIQPEAFEQQVVATRPESHVSNCAISLVWLISWVKRHPMIRSKSMTTGAVCFDIIKPAVKEAGCRYVDLMMPGEARSSVSSGRRFFFISHGWGRPFIELVEQLKAHFKAHKEEVFVWLDIFAINQNEGASQGDDLAQLKEVVEYADQTLMILDKEGSVLTRIWCLFEAW